MLKKILELLIFAITLIVGFYFQWGTANFVFFILFIFLIMHPIPSRFTAGGATVFLLTTVILTIFKQNNWVESTAIWAYYLIIFTAMLFFSELQKEKEKDII